jgi:hypothetical protein
MLALSLQLFQIICKNPDSVHRKEYSKKDNTRLTKGKEDKSPASGNKKRPEGRFYTKV